jgi:hypothetical protein
VFEEKEGAPASFVQGERLQPTLGSRTLVKRADDDLYLTQSRSKVIWVKA